jgi:glycosyltransferase involved in cell wall biosynthesis
LIERASQLRNRASEFDVTILHVHPFDVVPSLAFGRCSDSPPIILVNHADHVFWLGVIAADVVASIRDTGQRLAQTQRGLVESRTFTLPVPLKPPADSNRDSAFRKRMDIPDGAVLMVSVASAYKFGRPRARQFLRVADLLLRSVRELYIVVVGPEEQVAWRRRAKKFPGRLKVVGVMNDLDAVYRSADLYLDSYPVGSLTSVLEAGSYELPVVQLEQNSDPARLLISDDPRISSELLPCSSPTELVDRVQRLTKDETYRRAKGHAIAQALVSAESQSRWHDQLENLLRSTTASRRNSQLRPYAIVDAVEASEGVTKTHRLICRIHPSSDLRSSYFEHHVDNFPAEFTRRLSDRDRLSRVLARLRAPQTLRSLVFLVRLSSVARAARRNTLRRGRQQ